MNESDAAYINIQIALLEFAIIASRYDEIQNSPVHLPEIFAGNEEGTYRPMTKAELETFIDHRWRAHFERLEKEVQQLKTRLNSVEAEGNR